MVDLGGLDSIIGGGRSSPEGMEQIIKFLTSPEGMAMIQQLIASPQGKPLAGQQLIPILGNPGVPDTIKQTLQQCITN